MPCGLERLHLAPRRKRFAPVPTLEKSERFSWTLEAEEALDRLKRLLTNPPILIPPAMDEALLLYVAASTQVVSAAVVVERQEEGHTLPTQRPV